MRLLGVAIVALALAGCQSTGSPAKYQPTTTGNSGAGVCDYASIGGNEYEIAPPFRQFVTNEFFYNPNIPAYQQLDKSKYTSLTSQSFKILETGVITVEDQQARSPYLSHLRYSEVEIDGTPYMLDKSFSTKLVTEDCSIFYLGGYKSPASLISNITRANGEQINNRDLFRLIGNESLAKREMTAEVTYDEFDKVYKIRTPAHKDMIIRGAIKEESDDLMMIQLYTDLLFLDDWGNISRAVDDSGTSRELTKIDTDIDCSSSSLFGCRLTETVGVSLTEDFLVSNQDGFKIKFSGSKEKIVEVQPFMIKGFLEGLKEARSKI